MQNVSHIEEYWAEAGLKIKRWFDLTPVLPGIFDEGKMYRYDIREGDAFCFELKGHQFFIIVTSVDYPNATFQFQWSGDSSVVGVGAPVRTRWENCPLVFGFAEVTADNSRIGRRSSTTILIRERPF